MVRKRTGANRLSGILGTLPDTIIMAMASPMARPTPSTTAVATPERAAGREMRKMVSMWCAQGQAGLLILPGDRLQGGLRHVDDGGQDHHRQDHDSGQQGGPGGQLEGPLDGGDQHDHAPPGHRR